jgi:uracil-DNA glycosylase family 4
MIITTDPEEYAKKSSLYGPFRSVVLYRGVMHPKIMFIGEAPGKDEDKSGIPFSGRSGKMIDNWIKKYNIKMISGMMYAVPIMPLNVIGFVRKPKLMEITYFKPYVDFMLKKYKPTLLVLLGNMACMSLAKLYVGALKEQLIPKWKYYLTAMQTPAFYMQHGENGLDDFGKMFGAAIKPLFPDVKPNIEIDEKEKTDEEFVKELIKK